MNNAEDALWTMLRELEQTIRISHAFPVFKKLNKTLSLVNSFEKSELAEKLYNLIYLILRDSDDPLVIAECLHCLSIIHVKCTHVTTKAVMQNRCQEMAVKFIELDYTPVKIACITCLKSLWTSSNPAEEVLAAVSNALSLALSADARLYCLEYYSTAFTSVTSDTNFQSTHMLNMCCEVAKAVFDPDILVRVKACEVLGMFKGMPLVLFQQLLNRKQLNLDESEHFSRPTRVKKNDQDFIKVNIQTFADRNLTMKTHALMLEPMHGAFIHALEDEYEEVRSSAVSAISALCTHNGIEFMNLALENLIYMLNDEIEQVRILTISELLEFKKSHPFAKYMITDNLMSTILVGLTANSSYREGARRLLANFTMDSKDSFIKVMDAAQETLHKYPKEAEEIYDFFLQFGRNNIDLFDEELLNHLIGYNPQYDYVPKPLWDSNYVSILHMLKSIGEKENLKSLLPQVVLDHLKFYDEYEKSAQVLKNREEMTVIKINKKTSKKVNHLEHVQALVEQSVETLKQYLVDFKAIEQLSKSLETQIELFKGPLKYSLENAKILVDCFIELMKIRKLHEIDIWNVGIMDHCRQLVGLVYLLHRRLKANMHRKSTIMLTIRQLIDLSHKLYLAGSAINPKDYNISMPSAKDLICEFQSIEDEISITASLYQNDNSHLGRNPDNPIGIYSGLHPKIRVEIQQHKHPQRYSRNKLSNACVDVKLWEDEVVIWKSTLHFLPGLVDAEKGEAYRDVLIKIPFSAKQMLRAEFNIVERVELLNERDAELLANTFNVISKSPSVLYFNKA